SMPLADWLRIALPPSIASPSLAHPSQQFIPVIYTGVIVLALALLGATTLRRNIATRGWIALLAFAIVVSTGPSLLTRLPLTVFRYPARLVPIGVLALAALAVAGWERVRTNRRWVDLLLVLIVASDLLLRAAPLLRTAPFRTDVVPYAREIGARGKLLRFGDIDPLQRANWISGYLNLYDRRFDTFTAAPLASEAYVRMYRELLIAPTFAKFSYAGVVFILTTYELPHPWVHVTHANDVHVFRNREAYPMAAHFAPGLRSVRHASWSLDTSHARISVNAPRDGVLVLRQQTARGWKVRVDGRPAEALVIDGLFRGVRVTRGHHDVEWTYDPPFFLPGAAMTIVTLLTLQIAVFVKHSKARRKKSFSSCPSNLE
ncbi:MAG: YfhO family protein, partial [Acidobacteriota bacterium]|nr:YfhO family protein [Acidobacteriota bacterium]